MSVTAMCVTASMGSSTVELNNVDTKMPIYLYYTGNYASGNDVVYVSIYAGSPGSISHALYKADTTGNNVGDYVFTVDRNGYFDAGVGIVPALIEDGGNVELTLVAWLGDKTGPTSTPTAVSGSATWSQLTGVWNPTSGEVATGPVLQIPNSVIVEAMPEASSVTLGLLGGAALLTTNKIMKTIKGKIKAPPVSPAKPTTNTVTTVTAK